MYLLETVGVIALSGGITVAVIAGFVLYLAGHGVEPVPNPYRPGDVHDTPERRAQLSRYNARYVAITRTASRVSLGAAVVGLILLIVGSFSS